MTSSLIFLTVLKNLKSSIAESGFLFEGKTSAKTFERHSKDIRLDVFVDVLSFK